MILGFTNLFALFLIFIGAFSAYASWSNWKWFIRVATFNKLPKTVGMKVSRGIMLVAGVVLFLAGMSMFF